MSELDWLEGEKFDDRLARHGFETAADEYGEPSFGWSIEVYAEQKGERYFVALSDGDRIQELILPDLLAKTRFLGEHVPTIKSLSEYDELKVMFDSWRLGSSTEVTWSDDTTTHLSGHWTPVSAGMVSETLSYKGSKTWRQQFIPWTAIQNVVVVTERKSQE